MKLKLLHCIRFCFGLILLSHTIPGLQAQEGQPVFGRITDGLDPLAGVRVVVSGASQETYSDADGNYRVNARPRDIIAFSRSGLDTVRIVVEDVTGRLNIEMRRLVQELEEVVLTEQKMSRNKRLAIQYYSKPSIINTSFGYLDSKASAYHLKVIEGSQLNPAAPDILSAIRNKIPGVQIAIHQNPTTGRSERALFTRSPFSARFRTPAIFEIDHVLFTDPPTWLDISTVLRIGIIPGLQATWRYGSLAAGGVVIINTRNFFHGERERGADGLYDQARLRNNFASADFLVEEDLKKGAPRYAMELAGSESLVEALKVLERYGPAYSHEPGFFLEGYNYLYGK